MASATALWGDRIAVEVLGGVPLQMYTQRPRRVEHLLAFADRWGARPHLVQGERVVTFDVLRHAIGAKARELVALEVGRGARVFLLGWNSPEWIVNFWACLQIGATPVLANGWWNAGELADALVALQPALTLADAHGAAKMPPAWRCGPWAVDTTHAPTNPSSTNAFQAHTVPRARCSGQ